MKYILKIIMVMPLILLCYLNGASQDIGRLRIGAELGAAAYYSEYRENTFVRALASDSDFNLDNSFSLSTSLGRVYGGLKVEYSSENKYRSIITGIRFSRIFSSSQRNNYWLDGTTDHFFIMYKQDGLNTEYAQVTSLKQNSSFIGIPVDIRFFTFRQKFCRLYFKVGIDFSLRVSTKNSVVFLNQGMNKYEKEVAAVLGKPANFLSTLNPGMGLKFGNEDKLNINLEVHAPAFILSDNVSTLATGQSGFGAGIQVYVSYPLK